ncbi:MAG: metal ABC transporter ATP-binding protein [Anaerolineales bacterium]
MRILTRFRKSKILPIPTRHQPDSPILEVSGLNVRYNGRAALENISFELEEGARVAVVGPNGAGKSTLFKVIAGIMPPASGYVKVAGAGPGGHICIAYLPQRSQVDWDFPVSVADVVMMGRIGKLGPLRFPSVNDWELVHQSLNVVGLEELASWQIGELSGGQQQRMFIARALAQEAELILMDEPFTGLDLTSQEGIIQILDELRKHGVTLLLATHDLKMAGERFDRVMLLNRRLLGFGEPQQVFTAERLVAAYGVHLRLVDVGEQVLALSDTCCDEGFIVQDHEKGSGG